jgi:hydrogenase maturation protein HypF
MIAGRPRSAFPPCEACSRDYQDPRQPPFFHTEAIACPSCRPRLSHPIEAIAEKLNDGRIVALKFSTGLADLQRMKRC